MNPDHDASTYIVIVYDSTPATGVVTRMRPAAHLYANIRDTLGPLGLRVKAEPNGTAYLEVQPASDPARAIRYQGETARTHWFPTQAATGAETVRADYAPGMVVEGSLPTMFLSLEFPFGAGAERVAGVVALARPREAGAASRALEAAAEAGFYAHVRARVGPGRARDELLAHLAAQISRAHSAR